MVLFDRLSIRWKIFLIILVALLPTASTTLYLVCANYKLSAALSLPALALVIGFTRVLTRRYLVAPLEDMLNITRSVKNGDLTVRLDPRYPADELGALAQSLNEMTAALEKRMIERDHAESRLRLSEEYLAAILNSIEDGVIATDTVGRVTRMNAAAEKLTGWSLEDAFRRLLEEVYIIVDEESPQSVVNPVANLLENGEVVGLANHAILIARDGTEHPIANSGASIKDSNGDMIGVVLVFRDQTEERAKERRIVQERDFYLTLFEGVPALIWRAGPDGRRDYFNKTWLDFRGRTLEEESGDGWVEGVHPEDLLRCLPTHISAFDEREPYEMEYRLLHQDGEYRWIFDVGRPYKGPGGAFGGFIGSCFDITEKKRVSNALARSEELLGTVFDATPDLIMVIDRECRIVCSNWHGICSDLPAEKREQGLHCHDILQKAEQCIPGECPHLQVFISGVPYVNIKDLPGLGYFEMRSYPLFDETGAVDLVVRTLRDITTQHKTEEQHRHLQKMEAISNLVGGIAHDFNNNLSDIAVYGTLLMSKLAEDDPLRRSS